MIAVTDILALQQLPEVEPLDPAEPGLMLECGNTCTQVTCSFTCGRVSCRTTAP